MKKITILRFKRFFLVLFVFSLPFEYWDPFGITSFFSVTKMAGVGYALSSLLSVRESFSIEENLIKPVFLLFLFWFWLLLMSLINYSYSTTVSVLNFTVLQNIVLYWLLVSELKGGRLQVKLIMLVFILSMALMSILLMLGIGIDSDYIEGYSRLTFFGNNSNSVGVFAGLAIVFSAYFLLNPSQAYGIAGYGVLALIPSFINILLLTGSRGALITVVLSVVLMVIMNRTVLYKKAIQVSILVLAATFFIERLVASEVMFSRMTEFVEEGKTTGRDIIWDHVLTIIYANPFTGYGSTGFETQMINLLGYFKDAHNLFLYVMVTTGIVGFSIFSYFLYLHLKKCVISFKHGSVLKVVLFVFYLTTVLKTGGVIRDKLMWLLLAIIFSATYFHSKRKNTLRNEASLRNR